MLASQSELGRGPLSVSPGRSWPKGIGQGVINELAQAMELGYPTSKLAPYRAVILARSEQYAEAEPILRNALAASDEPQPEVAEALRGSTSPPSA